MSFKLTNYTYYDLPFCFLSYIPYSDAGSDISSAAAEEGRGCVVLCNDQDNICSIRKDFQLFTKDH